MKNQIIVGNIGCVLNTDSLKECLITFKEYKAQSESGIGRAGGEDIVWFKNGEPYREFIGFISKSQEGC